MISLTYEEFNKLLAIASSSQASQQQPSNAQNIACNVVTSTQYSGKSYCNYVSTVILESNISWIIDTGAIYHMICTPFLLFSS